MTTCLRGLLLVSEVYLCKINNQLNYFNIICDIFIAAGWFLAEIFHKVLDP